ncbi:MAG: hypothetical protein WCK18_17965 [Prolixibacteraceae bacterium]
MKVLEKITSSVFCWIFLLLIASCQKKVITEFGFDAAISGRVIDQASNIVAGDITSTGLLIKAMGQDDKVTMDMRVKGDGTYQNTKMFPKKFRIWITGPVTPVADTLRVDFATDNVVVKDFVVIPFITVNKPTVVGSITATSVNVSYAMAANSGKVISKRELYCSTIFYPNATTGSGPFFTSQKITLTTNSGNVTITGLESKTKYYIRIGAQATGATGFNYSEQIEITTL